jgi:hypothetical protein
MKLRDSQVYISAQTKWCFLDILMTLIRILLTCLLTIPFYTSQLPSFIILEHNAGKAIIKLVELSPVRDYGAKVVMPTKAVTAIGIFSFFDRYTARFCSLL